MSLSETASWRLQMVLNTLVWIVLEKYAAVLIKKFELPNRRRICQGGRK